jgi:hypothetical protein
MGQGIGVRRHPLQRADPGRHDGPFVTVDTADGLEGRTSSYASSAELGPRWVRVATVEHGHQRSPTVANGSEEQQVAGLPVHAAGMMRRGDSDCGPEGHRTLRAAWGDPDGRIRNTRKQKRCGPLLPRRQISSTQP